MNRQVVVHPILFAVYPVAFLYSRTQRSFDVSIMVAPLVVNVGLTLLLWYVLRKLTGERERSAIYVSVAVLGFYSFGAANELLIRVSLQQGLEHVTLTAKLIATSLLIVGVAAVLCLKLGRHISRLTYVVNVVGSVLVFMPAGEMLVEALTAYRARSLLPDRSAFHETPAVFSQATEKPDIYYIILDGYGRADFLADEYALDNSEFIDSLKEKGFYIAEQSRSNYPMTLVSLASSMNFTYLDEVIGGNLQPNTDWVFMRELLADNRACRLLRAAGYSIVSFESEYSEVGIRDVDVHLSEWWFLNAYQIGMLQMTPLPAIFQGLRKPLLYDLHRERILHTLEKLPEVAALPGPKFVFAHIFFAHEPFVFGRHGERVNRDWGYSWNKAPVATREEYLEGYRMQVSYLNERLEAAVDHIVRQSERRPIVILQGDHGPSLGTSFERLEDTDVRERYSIFNAYLFPNGGNQMLYPSISPANTFRVLFNYYFGTSYPLLEDKSYYVSEREPYRFIPVLPEAFAALPGS